MKHTPFVSVLMPVRNEGSFIERSLGAVLAQDYPRDRIEIIVADGLSTDGTREIMKAMREKNPIMTLVDNPGKIVSTGLNAALRLAKGEIVVRVDGHTVIACDYVRECVTALEQSGADNVSGPMRAIGDGFFGQAVASATSSPFGVGGARFHYSENEEWVDTGYLGAWRRDVFKRVGVFDEEMIRNQDDEFNYRLRAAGGKILLNPRIKSRYYNRATIRSLWRQYFQYGYWKVRVLQKHPRQMQFRHFVPAAFVCALLLSLLMVAIRPAIGNDVFLSLLGMYLLATAAVSIWLVGRRRRWGLAPSLALSFPMLHFSYGIGFLVGLAKFWKCWREPREVRVPTNSTIPG